MLKLLCPSARLYICVYGIKSLRTAERTFMKLDIRVFYENVRKISVSIEIGHFNHYFA